MDTTARAQWGGRRWVFAVLLIAVAVALYLGRSSGDKQTGPIVERQNDCPQEHLVIHRPDGDSIVGSDLPLLGPTADMPEFHDCQRFVISPKEPGAIMGSLASDGHVFGPLVAIWVAYRVDSVLTGQSPIIIRRPGDTVPVAGGADSMPGTATDSARTKAIAVAVIYDFDRTAGYSPLGIAPGFNCLYMWHSGSWQARVVRLGERPTRCFEPVPITDSLIVAGTRLEVRPARLPIHVKATDIPPVARWDWGGSQQFIGIRCGAEWCEVGRKGFDPARSEEESPIGTAVQAAFENIALPGFQQANRNEVSRVVGVKGWYDQQRLDIRDSNGRLVLTDIVGTVFPHPATERVPGAAYDGRWIPALYLYLPADYAGKVPLKQGVTRVYLCHGDATACPQPRPAPSCNTFQQDPLDRWWAKIVSATGDPMYRCVRRRTHGGMSIPASAARWNWSELDVTTWSQCKGGCCTVN